MSKQIIAVDMDDVLALHAEAFVEFSNKHYGTDLTKETYDERWANLWHVDNDEIERRALEFHTPENIAAYGRIDEAVPALKKLCETYELVIVTARSKNAIEATYAWLDKHFPGIFSGVHFVPIWEPGNTVTKAQICREIGAEYLIDDVVRHCDLAMQGGIQALLFGNYNWNRGEIEPGVVRVQNWTAVQEYFDGIG